MRPLKFLQSPLASLLLSCATLTGWAQPLEVEGVKLEASSQLGAAKLQLNGAGLRTKVFFKVYVAALYTPQKATSAAQLLTQTGARRVTITMLRNVDAESFAGALNDGLRDNHTEAQFTAMKPRIDALNANLKAVGEAKKGDVIHFEFVPDVGTQVTVNGQVRGNVIAGEDFFTAVLRIWLGDKPVDANLKKALIGS
ncbi:chalcone isomerase family protein [Rhodoferax sp.]|uniref:chalcone isomerase family protein n=1 Tax=Rhodoferax sp. TaxID=50421 RepID=UPI0025EA2F07|nr:chalcone isomerase family protein [Rhodoferax sp.]MCM2296494.1 chalcone isomerase family protein [Rhodoferax sp.]